MKTIRQLKDDFQLNKDLAGLMDVLKGIAASEFWAMSKRMGRFSKFMEAFQEFFAMIDFSTSQHPFTQGKGAMAIIMVTSNEGFMGGLNSKVINTALASPGAQEAQLIIVGERGSAYLEAMGKKYVEFPGVGAGECFESALRLRDYIIERAKKGEFGKLVLFYPRSVSFMVQRVEELLILPCSQLFEKKTEDEDGKKKTDPIVESSIDGMIEYLLETWIIQKLFQVFEDSKLAEFSARTVRLEESYQMLVEQGKQIRYQYFRGYHELVDAEMRDIYSAQIVRKKSRKKLTIQDMEMG